MGFVEEEIQEVVLKNFYHIYIITSHRPLSFVQGQYHLNLFFYNSDTEASESCNIQPVKRPRKKRKKMAGPSEYRETQEPETQMKMNNLRDMVLGKPAPLVSTFRLSYYSILNLMSLAEGQFTAEHVIRNLFHQFHYEKALPDMGKRVSMLEQEVVTLDATGETEVSEYHNLQLEIAQLEMKMMSQIIRPEMILYFLVPGRLIKIREGGTDWGWGVVVNVVKKPVGGYIVDTLLHCSSGSNENTVRPKPCPPRPGEKGEMHVDVKTAEIISKVPLESAALQFSPSNLQKEQTILQAHESSTRQHND